MSRDCLVGQFTSVADCPTKQRRSTFELNNAGLQEVVCTGTKRPLDNEDSVDAESMTEKENMAKRGGG